jgi:DNA-binding MarR family transcriptional regulator
MVHRVKKERYSWLYIDDDKQEEEQIVPTSDNKQRIYRYIKDNPGSHLRKISQKLLIAMGDIQYQLKFLEKSGLIKSRHIWLYKTYYTFSILGERYENILAILQQETPRDVILYLIENPGATQSEIVRHKGFTAPTINWHMSRLIEIGLVYSCKEGRFVKYYLEGNVEDIITLLKLYHPSVWNKLSNRLAELFLDIASQSRPGRDSAGENTNEQAEERREIEDRMYKEI